MDAAILRVVGRRVVPFHQQLMAFGFGEQRQLPDALIRIGDDALEQCLESAAPCARWSRRRTDRCCTPSCACRPAAVSRTDSVRSNLALCACERQAARLHALKRERGIGRVLQHKHHLEQRIAAHVAAGGEFLDQLLEGQVLMRVGAQRASRAPVRATR